MKIELNLVQTEVILDALSIAFLHTGAKKFDRIRTLLLNKKVMEVFDVKDTNATKDSNKI